MRIAAAQMRPEKGNIVENLEKHKNMIATAISYHADAIFFPELSVTGYEPSLAKDLATSENDGRFDDFQSISDKHRITIGIGVPTKSDSGIRISMIVFQPNKPRQTYSKQKLHSDEFPYFVCGHEQMILTMDNVKIAPAICYESLQIDHADYASKLGAEVYGHCDNFESVGKSAVWSNEGRLVGELDDSNEGIIIYDSTTQEVTKK
ncbi:hypothetical protein AV654_30545 [Paenibacillus elgii]|uniref:CN hydrolase domain-containing protein n=1 Tax=Paenibacillus elgii TaxID=189691 RepID=A0A161S5B4_9BACL|nr:carbon-nitrogen hydrolase family protein [Paenibacillus elgii]KZE74305.1 hypothetical protein AV654_30545 [Paenibacillus elgii]